MVGRGTRLRPDLFGPGKDKEFFSIFDFCQNLEFFSMNPDAVETAVGKPLGRRLFEARLDLIGALDRANENPAPSSGKMADAAPTAAAQQLVELRTDVVALLHGEVASMSLENFVVRPKRKLVETYREPGAWVVLTDEARRVLAEEVAGLPSGLDAEEEEAKRFDHLLLRLQLTVLRRDPSFERLREQVKAIAALLEEKAAIPMVQTQIVLIQMIQTDDWWQDVTAPMLETVRRNLRSLVKLIDKRRKVLVYTDFEDEIGSPTELSLTGIGGGDGFEKFREKARVFLREHEGHITIYKLRWNKPLTGSDLDELERMLASSGVGTVEQIRKAKEKAHGLGLFVRSLVGLDREAAKEAFAGFLSGRTLNASQIEFVDLIVNQLTEHGVMGAELLYESPFTDVTPRGPDALFDPAAVDQMVAILETVRASAEAA